MRAPGLFTSDGALGKASCLAYIPGHCIQKELAQSQVTLSGFGIIVSDLQLDICHTFSNL